jgi:uncharacterized protein YndB with AHSA1/START domain/DNA-binding transcriptional ArsR family regulator
MDDASSPPDHAPVFRALADPTRRRLLDLLLERGGRTVGELAAPFEPGADGPGDPGQGMTRFGVMKHLRILEEAGLVVSRRDGRATRLYLNPVPIRELSRRWLDRYAEHTSDALLDLKLSLEGTVMPESELFTQLYQVFIRATPEQIWQAITDPEQTKQYFHRAEITVTPQHMHSHGPDGTVYGDSAVEVFDPPHTLVYGWDSMYDPEMAAEPTSRVTFEIEEVGDGVCKLTLLHDRLDASPITAKNVSGAGWMFVLSNLKSWLETGEALSIAG